MLVLEEFRPEDLDELVELCRAMWHEAPRYRDHPFRPSKIGQWGQLFLTNEDWLCVIARKEVEGKLVPVGFVAAGAVEMLFCELKTVDDLGFFVLPEWRGTTAAVRLLRYLEAWGKAKGVEIRMGVTTGTNQAQVGKFLARFGYEATGELYTKAL